MHPAAYPRQFDTPLLGEGASAAACNGTTTITTHTISPVRPVVFA